MSGRYANKRDANEQGLVDILEAHGFSVSKMDKPVDLLIGKHGMTWIAEVKHPKKDLRPSQKAFYETWRGNKTVFKTEADVMAFIGAVNEAHRRN